MRVLRSFAQGVLLSAALLSLNAQSTNTNTVVIGQWDFNSSNLTATVGAPLQFVGGIESATVFSTVQINGRPAQVMRFPAATESQGYLATFPLSANGGGTNLNQYTLLMDIMWPGESDGLWRAIFNSSTNNLDDAEIFVNPDNEIGIFNDYALPMAPNIWHRLVLVYDLSSNSVVRYLNGVVTNAASQTLEGSGVDSRFSLRGGMLLFADNDLETAAGFVNSIQLRSGTMGLEEIEALGGASSGGLSGGSDPVISDVRIEGISRSGGNVILTVTAGKNVQIQKTVSLATPNWQDVGAPSASGTFTIPSAENTSFFRARIL